jgi:hypothetical protein
MATMGLRHLLLDAAYFDVHTGKAQHIGSGGFSAAARGLVDLL